MDPLTHGLSAFALQRAFFPRAPRPVIICTILAGMLVDLDWLSGAFGAASFLRWSYGPSHSISAAVVFAILLSVIMRTYAKSRGVNFAGNVWWIAPLCAALLHVGMDSLLSVGTKILWPFTARRIALDWAPAFDLWVLVLLAAALLLPELFRLVSDEIGAKSKKPRGQVGAIVALTLLAIYFVGRGMLHAEAEMALLQHSYLGQSARRGAAFPDATSPLTWHGVVETESALHLVTVPAGPMANFDPESAVHIHKAEPSPMLDAAQKTAAAKEFMAAARFPKATVQKETEGYSVEIRDLKHDALGERSRVAIADINTDAAATVKSARIEWLSQPARQ